MSSAAALASALDQLLEPLVEIALRSGMPHRALSDIAKRVYVRVAEREGGVAGRKQSTSRMAVRTGLTRKEVSRLRKEPPVAAEETTQRYSRASRVVGGWLRDERFRAGDAPLALAFDGAESSFAALVKEYGGDVPPRAVLDELARVGTVRVDEQGLVHLVERGYLPRGADADKLQILGSDVAGLLSTIRRNLDARPDEAWFQRKVFADNLSTPALPDLRQLTAEQGQALLERLAGWMAEHDLDEHPQLPRPGGGRAGVGIYYFEEARDEEAA